MSITLRLGERMSCITEILKVKGDKEFIVCGKIAIEGGGIYKGYEYLITFVKHGHRCGYVAISNDHPLFKIRNSVYDFPDLEVHGGVTYFDNSRFEDLTGGHKCIDKWIGFDACHYNDTEDIEAIEKYFGKTELSEYRKKNPKSKYDPDAEYRSFDYMKTQCELLIDQLINIKMEINDE